MKNQTLVSKLHKPVSPIISITAIIGIVLLITAFTLVAYYPYIFSILRRHNSSFSVPPKILYNSTTVTSAITSAPSHNPSPTPTPSTLPITYKTYTNSAIGISIQYPDHAYNNFTYCRKTPNQYSSVLEGVVTPTNIFEDPQDKSIYLAFTHDAWAFPAGTSDPKNCKEFDVDLNYIKNGVTDGHPPTHYVWNTHFQYATVSNNDDLMKFIQKIYGKTCEDITKTPIDNSNFVYSVSIKSTGPAGGCWINYDYGLLYSPQKNFAITWDIGQQPPWQAEGQVYPLTVSILH